MASFLWTILLVSLAAPCVEAATVALGASCNSGDTCGTGTACESGGTCEIIQQKVGRKCTPGSSPEAAAVCGPIATTFLECPNGATTCACKTGYAGNSGESCVVAQQKVGRTCTPGDTASGVTVCGDPATTNLECPDGDTKCACKDGYEGSDGEDCVVAAKRVGRTCTPATATEDTKCGALATTHLECTGDTDTTCACKSGYTGSKGGTCSVKSGAVGLVGSLVTVLLAAILHVFMRH